jgi:hypothetical protein
MMLKTTTESPMMSPTGCTKCPAIRTKIMNPLTMKRRKYSQRPGQQMKIHRNEQTAKK